MKHSIPAFYVLFFVINAHAQQLSPTVVAASGGYYSNEYGMLSFTSGELAAVETYQNQYLILTQGFQQPEDNTTDIKIPANSDFFAEVMPNPSMGEFRLLVNRSRKEVIALNIVDVMGRNVFTDEIQHDEEVSIHHIDLRQCAGGLYFIHLGFKTWGIEQLDSQLIKINIIR